MDAVTGTRWRNRGGRLCAWTLHRKVCSEATGICCRARRSTAKGPYSLLYPVLPLREGQDPADLATQYVETDPAFTKPRIRV